MALNTMFKELQFDAMEQCQNTYATLIPRAQSSTASISNPMMIYSNKQALPKDMTKRKAENMFMDKRQKTIKRLALIDLNVNVDTKPKILEQNPIVQQSKDLIHDGAQNQNVAPSKVGIESRIFGFGIFGNGIMKTNRNETSLKIKNECNHCIQQPIFQIEGIPKLEENFRKPRSLTVYGEVYDESFYTTILNNPQLEVKFNETDSPKVPPGVQDFDKENLNDPCEVSGYAVDIFCYMKEREKNFQIGDYMSRQIFITKWMRTLLIDWLVEVQLDLALNHETLYLAVKVTDIYLNKVVVKKEVLKLVGATSLLIASKYDDRVPPLIEDFLSFCGNAFTREQFIKMEQDIFKAIGCNLGIPLSYKFLRRFARCCKTTLLTLTLARYILELSLLEYSFIFVSESKIACAALYLAFRMLKAGSWTPTLEYYSGYKLCEFITTVLNLNAMMHKKPKDQVQTIRCKYWHESFFEVAKVPLIEDNELFSGDDNNNVYL